MKQRALGLGFDGSDVMEYGIEKYSCKTVCPSFPMNGHLLCHPADARGGASSGLYPISSCLYFLACCAHSALPPLIKEFLYGVGQT
mmetsp:Transcript_20561/g.56763  ORF Transcript_20561/g.56763 Transcript_20561/m.56763 type:complete len:86 (+) Transcript_20561:418-675(+)